MEIPGFIIFFNFSGSFFGSGRAAGRATCFFNSRSQTGGALKPLVSCTGFAGENCGAFAVGAGYFFCVMAEGTGAKGKKTGKQNRKNEKQFFHIHSFVE